MKDAMNAKFIKDFPISVTSNDTCPGQLGMVTRPVSVPQTSVECFEAILWVKFPSKKD